MGQTADELRMQIEQQRSDLSRDIAAIEDRVSPSRVIDRRRARARRSWHDARDRVMGSRESVASMRGDAATRAQSAAGGIKDGMSGLPQQAHEQMDGAPLVVAAIAFGAGFLAAVAFPPTSKEQELVDRYEEPIAEGAAQIKESVTGVVREVADNLSDDAKEAAEEVTQQARKATEKVKDSAQQAKQG